MQLVSVRFDRLGRTRGMHASGRHVDDHAQNRVLLAQRVEVGVRTEVELEAHGPVEILGPNASEKQEQLEARRRHLSVLGDQQVVYERSYEIDAIQRFAHEAHHSSSTNKQKAPYTTTTSTIESRRNNKSNSNPIFILKNSLNSSLSMISLSFTRNSSCRSAYWQGKTRVGENMYINKSCIEGLEQRVKTLTKMGCSLRREIKNTYFSSSLVILMTSAWSS